MIAETGIELAEHHITFAGVMAIIGRVAYYWLKERDVGKRIRSRLNALWWDRCAQRRDPYTPVENGVPAVVPPKPE